MVNLLFSRRAGEDLREIALFTLRIWGPSQAELYIAALEACCRAIADHPKIGAARDDIRPGIRRFGCRRHVILYRSDPVGVLISRILHGRMLPERQPID
jgi:toxin ParE1/3/4